VVVLERAAIGWKAGETFGPRVRLLLAELGAEEAPAVPFRGVRSAWGSSELIDRPSLVHPLGEGWHVDRARFEGTLERMAVASRRRSAARRGACSAMRERDGFAVVNHAGEQLVRRATS